MLTTIDRQAKKIVIIDLTQEQMDQLVEIGLFSKAEAGFSTATFHFRFATDITAFEAHRVTIPGADQEPLVLVS